MIPLETDAHPKYFYIQSSKSVAPTAHSSSWRARTWRGGLLCRRGVASHHHSFWTVGWLWNFDSRRLRAQQTVSLHGEFGALCWIEPRVWTWKWRDGWVRGIFRSSHGFSTGRNTYSPWPQHGFSLDQRWAWFDLDHTWKAAGYPLNSYSWTKVVPLKLKHPTVGHAPAIFVPPCFLLLSSNGSVLESHWSYFLLHLWRRNRSLAIKLLEYLRAVSTLLLYFLQFGPLQVIDHFHDGQEAIIELQDFDMRASAFLLQFDCSLFWHYCYWCQRT